MGQLKKLAVAVVAWSALTGCESGKQQSSSPAAFELRDFSVTEEKDGGTKFSSPSNTFRGIGTLLAPPELRDKTLGVFIELRDRSAGPSAKPEQAYVLVRAGVGTVETRKGEYGEVLPAPDYSWSILGWHELAPGTLRTSVR